MEERKSKGRFRECVKPGNRVRFFIAVSIFILQQFCGQNSISYYAPQVFQAIGINSTNSSLFASGIYGMVKVVATTIYLFVGIEQIGRKKSLVGGGFLMGVFFFILGAIYFTHTPDVNAATFTSVSALKPSSIAMAVMIYCYVVPYCFSWGPVPWIYCSEIFSNSTRSYGMATAAGSQWIFNFIQALVTPSIFLHLSNGTAFFLFASINMLSAVYGLLLPETRGLSLEDMDILFGSVSSYSRNQDLKQVHNNLHGLSAVEFDILPGSRASSTVVGEQQAKSAYEKTPPSTAYSYEIQGSRMDPISERDESARTSPA